ncbi:MAG: DNA ligase [Syntrophomonadaceae bacterium]|nr:DNA ligase [Syntrophomonadaceae bacterium]
MKNHVIERLTGVMEPVLWPEAFNDSRFTFQVKWDGVRILSVIDEDGVTLVNKHGNFRTLQFEELHQLPKMIKAEYAVLDGEVVALKEGKPSFPAVMRRDRTHNPKQLAYLKQNIPVCYMVFDLLNCNGEDLTGKSLKCRRERLEQVLKPSAQIQLVEDFPAGKSLFQAVESMGMEGIVAKKIDSPYQAGKKHNDWLKIKCRRVQNCLVGGYTLRGNTVNALLLGAYQEDDFIYIGRVGSGLTGLHQELFSRSFPAQMIPDSPFANLTRTKGCYFLQPRIGVRVEYMEWTEDSKLRAPVIKEFIDVDRGDCQL